MRKIVCEICNSTKFLKENNRFICQTCGVEYSSEDVKNLLVDVEDVVNEIINNTNSLTQEIDNRVKNAMNEYRSGDINRAYGMFSDILNLDPDNYTAIIYKAIIYSWLGYLSDIDDNRIQNCAGDIGHGLYIMRERLGSDTAFKDKVDIILYDMYQLCSAIMEQYLYADMTAKSDFESNINSIIDDSERTMQRGNLNNGMLFYAGVAAKSPFLVGAGVGGALADSVIKAKERKRLNKEASVARNSFYSEQQKILDEKTAMVCNVMNFVAITILDLIENKAELDVDFCSFIENYVNSYETHIINNPLIEKNKHLVSDLNDIKKICQDAKDAQREREKADKERKKLEDKNRIAEYWNIHMDERKELENEKLQIAEQINELKKSIEEKQKEILEIQSKAISMPDEKGLIDKQRRNIAAIEQAKGEFGIFQKKEKKELEIRLENAYADLEMLRKQIELDKKRIIEENKPIQNQIDSICLEIEKKEREIEKLNTRIKQIDIRIRKPF